MINITYATGKGKSKLVVKTKRIVGTSVKQQANPTVFGSV